MVIVFGNLGTKKTSAQIIKLFRVDELVGMQVVAVVNFPSKEIVNLISEFLVMRGIGKDKEVILIQSECAVENGTCLG